MKRTLANYVANAFRKLEATIQPGDYELINTAGDGFFFHFRQAADAFRFAEALEQITATHNAQITDPIAEHSFRIGAATGHAAWDGGEPVGDVVNTASRLQAASLGGDMVIDRPTFDALPMAMQQQFDTKAIIRDKHDTPYEICRTTFGRRLPPLPDSARRAALSEVRAGQHRRLTLLQCGCDLFDAPSLRDALDPEEQHDLLLDFQNLCRKIAAPLGGSVVKATDCGLLICFGVPVALECAARRAVRMGLNLLRRMPAFNERLDRQHTGLHVSARIAIHSDRAVVTTETGAGGTLSVVGSMLPVVDQLEHLAAPDTVVISEDTHQLLKGFCECTSLGPRALKGTTGAKAVFRVHREAKGFGECTSLIPLIGRDREAALLQDRWELAVLGTSQVVQLVGEAGIGKSRQVRVLKDYVAGQSEGEAAQIIEWSCSSLEESDGHRFHAIAYLEEIIGLGPQDGPSQQLDKLAVHLDRLHLGGAEAVALLAALLSIPLDDRYPALGMSPLRQKEKTFDLLLDWLRALAEHRPVLFVIEDLHWAGPTTLEFLDLLVGQAQNARLLTLLTFRPEFAPPWRARGHHTQVALNRLTRRQTGELMLLKSGLPAIPESVLEQVAGQSDGVPLFVEELTAMMLEAGALRVVDGAVQVSDTFNVHAIPATLQELLMARLDRLASDLDVVQFAAAIGREFRYELLSAVASCSEESLQQELTKLVDAELLFQHGRPPTARYQFKHALIRDAAYQTLLKKKRQQFHLRIAEALEERLSEAYQPELLAHHFTEGIQIAKAIEYWARAGERAQQRGDAIEATDHFNRGLELVRHLPESRQAHAQEIQLLIGLGVALAATKGTGSPEVEATFAHAHAVCLQAGLTSELGAVVFGRLRYCMNRSMHVQALELAEELLRLAQQEGNVGFRVCAHCAIGVTLVSLGKHTEARPHLDEVIAVEPAVELRSAVHRYCLIDPWIVAHSFLSWSLWVLGFPERASEHSRLAVSTSESLGHAFSLGLALANASRLHELARNHDEAGSAAARALALGEEKGFSGIIAPARILSAWTMADAGHSEQAVIAIRRELDNLSAQGVVSDCNDLLTLLAEACAQAGQPKEGLKALAEAQAFADAADERFWQAEIYRLRGELLLQHDGTAVAAAETCFHQALAVARQQQARSLELRAALSLAELWLRQGKTQSAHELVKSIYAGFTEGFQTRDLQRAAAFLAQQNGT